MFESVLVFDRVGLTCEAKPKSVAQTRSIVRLSLSDDSERQSLCSLHKHFVVEGCERLQRRVGPNALHRGFIG
jgi:hypothetical protein